MTTSRTKRFFMVYYSHPKDKRKGKNMLSIGVCDDEVQTCMELEQMLYTYGKNRKLDLHVNVWNKGEDLCSFLEKGDTLQILFLDIELITMNGVQIGDFIRNKLDNYEMSIIYISSKTE